MASATLSEVQHDLPEYMRRVQQGEEIEVRLHDKIVGKIVPVEDPDDVVSDNASANIDWSELRDWRKKVWGSKPVSGKPTSEVVYESRGDR